MTDERTGKQYLVLDIQDIKYNDNQQVCHNHGGFLPEPRDERENQFLASLDANMFLLGATDKLVEGQWVWDSDGSPVTWKNWVSWTGSYSEPNGKGGENCVVMLQQYAKDRAGYRSEGWADIGCHALYSSVPTSVVCQRDPGELTKLSEDI